MSGLRALPDIKVTARGAIAEIETDLAFIRAADLVIDTSYQRDIGAAGKAHIIRIAERFSWAKFGALTVAPTGDGRYALIDGQHRAAAAKARGIELVPALIITLTPAEQAASFAAINGNVTPISSLHVFKAALAAGAQWAREVEACAASAGVKVLVYPKPVKTIGTNETMAVASLRKGLKTHGTSIVTAALRAAMTHPAPGLLNQHVIKMMIALAAEHVPAKGADRFIAAISDINLVEEARAAIGGASEAGISRAAFLEASIGDRLKEIFAEASA